MSKRPLLLLGLGLLSAAPVVALVAPLVEEAFKPADHEKIGKLIGVYVEAREKNEGVGKAEEAISNEFAKHEKRLKKTPLAYPADLGKALWASYDYEKNQKAKKGKIDTIEPASYFDPKTKLPYAIWLPVKYEAKKPYPVILCVPDKGETPQAHLTEKWTDAGIRENAILVGITMPADDKTWNDNPARDKQTGGGNIAWTFRDVSRNYAIDFDRVFVAGRGLGVEAALTFASRQVDRIASVIGRSGDAPEAIQLENLRNLPIFFAGAGAKATALEDAAKKLGYDIVHRKDDATEADIWSWMQAHPRNPNPLEVVLYPQAPAFLRSFWLEAVPTDASGAVYIKGKIDKPSNTITVEGEGITKFVIYLNDAMVDLDKPIKIVANGNDVSRTVQRSLPRVLDFIAGAKNDPGKFYVNSAPYDLPPKKKEAPKAGDPK